MALICAVSNEVPEVAVVSPSSGAVFEKRIIEKYIIENGVDPLSGKELRVEDLIEIKRPVLEFIEPPAPLKSGCEVMPVSESVEPLAPFSSAERLLLPLRVGVTGQPHNNLLIVCPSAYAQEVLNMWNMERILGELGTRKRCLACKNRKFKKEVYKVN